MPWGRVDDSLSDNPKVYSLRPEMRLPCLGLNVLAWAWCNRYLTDGVIPADVVTQVMGGTTALADELVRVNLWERTDSGFVVHDFLIYNPSKADVLRLRAERQAAGRVGGLATAQARGQAVAVAKSHPVPTPVPTPISRPPSRAEPRVDTQKMTNDEQKAAYIAAQTERFGGKS